MTERKAPVAVLGLGPMGSALAHTFLDGGHPTTVWNRTPGKADPLVERGAVRAGTPAEAVAGSELAVVCVIDYAAVRAIVEPAAHALGDTTLVNLTADLPDRAREMAEWAAAHGIAYLDGAIMTPVDAVGRPEAVYLHSGDEALYERSRPVLASLGGTSSLVGGDPGRAAAFDVALLDFFWTSMSGLVHALALGRAEGVSAAELAPFLQGIAELLVRFSPEIAGEADGDAHSGEDSTLASNAAGMAHIVEAASARGVDTGVMAAAVAVADRAIAGGHGTDGFSRLVDVLSPRSGGVRGGGSGQGTGGAPGFGQGQQPGVE